MTLEGRVFDKSLYDIQDTEGKRLLLELCEQCGIAVLSTDQFWKYGDVLVDLGEKAVQTTRVADTEFSTIPVVFFEAEMRGVKGDSPWGAAHNGCSNYRFANVSVIGRKVEDSKSLLQVSFDGLNAVIVLMRDARRRKETMGTVRGEDTRGCVPLGSNSHYP